jgi:hypothetical protein
MTEKEPANKTGTTEEIQEQPEHPLSKFTIDKRVSIVSIPVVMDPAKPLPDRIRVASFTYEIIHPDTGLAVAVHFSQEMLSKIGAAKGLLFFGFENPRLPDTAKSTWPHRWQYLSDAQLEKLEKSGLPVQSQQYILMEALQIGSFAQGLYYPSNVAQFFDSWVELMWQEYVVEKELRRYQDIYQQGQPVVTIDQPSEINLQNAETWIPLENCAVRIRSMWDRLQKYIIPLYFTGDVASDTTDKQYWRDLDAKARRMQNQEQLSLYQGLFQAILDIEASPLKGVRDALIHKLSYRPPGVVPSNNIPDSSFPMTVEELYQLVQDEHSRVREALIMLAAIIRAKTPPNREVSESLSSLSS